MTFRDAKKRRGDWGKGEEEKEGEGGLETRTHRLVVGQDGAGRGVGPRIRNRNPQIPKLKTKKNRNQHDKSCDARHNLSRMKRRSVFSDHLREPRLDAKDDRLIGQLAR